MIRVGRIIGIYKESPRRNWNIPAGGFNGPAARGGNPTGPIQDHTPISNSPKEKPPPGVRSSGTRRLE